MGASGSEREPPPAKGPAAPEGHSGPERRHASRDERDVVPVILTKKFAEKLDGIELGGRNVGDRLCLDADQAALIVAEGWAERAAPSQRRRPG